MARRVTIHGHAIPVEPGERTCLVQIETLTESKGPSGAPVEAWGPLDKVWMKRIAIDPIRADYAEKFLNHQRIAQPQTLWEFGYRSDMDGTIVNVPKQRRLTYQGRPYNIVAADVVAQREAIELITMSDGR